MFTRELLEEAHRHATGEDREHVTPWMRRERAGVTVRHRVDYSRHKWSVDRWEDYERVARIYAHLRPGQLYLGSTVAAARAAGEL